MSSDTPAEGGDRSALLAALADLRPQLHRYCARLTGSVIDGEDVVQDVVAKALVSLADLETTPLRPWLFRVAHNRALDLLRSRSIRAWEPIETAADRIAADGPDPLETLMRQEALDTAVSRFVELPVVQRSVVILKDVLDHSLEDIADLLHLTINAVKAHLARGRVRLREINVRSRPAQVPRAASAAVARYADLFNARDWDGLRDLLAEDVKLNQANRPLREGAREVGRFFTFYDGYEPVRVVPAWLEGREIVAVLDGASSEPDYFMWLEWRDGHVIFIHDYRYARYVLDGAELVASEPPPPLMTRSP